MVFVARYYFSRLLLWLLISMAIGRIMAMGGDTSVFLGGISSAIWIQRTAVLAVHAYHHR
jgi:hypothetical protein